MKNDADRLTALTAINLITDKRRNPNILNDTGIVLLVLKMLTDTQLLNFPTLTNALTARGFEENLFNFKELTEAYGKCVSMNVSADNLIGFISSSNGLYALNKGLVT